MSERQRRVSLRSTHPKDYGLIHDALEIQSPLPAGFCLDFPRRYPASISYGLSYIHKFSAVIRLLAPWGRECAPILTSSSYKLVTIISAAITSIVPAIVTAAIAVAGSIVPTSAIGTAARRRRTAGRWRRRWGIHLAAAAGPVISAHGSKHDGTVAIDIWARAERFGLGRNRCNSECEGCRRHSSYPAEFQHQHDTSPVMFFGGESAFFSPAMETSNKGASWISARRTRDILRYGKSEPLSHRGTKCVVGSKISADISVDDVRGS
jgi:hypothetical protein